MPVIGIAQLLIVPVTSGLQSEVSREVGRTMPRAGRQAGQALGRGMADGFSEETDALETKVADLGRAVGKAESDLSAARERRSKARDAESKALGELRVAELKLQEIRDTAGAKASQIAAAEERVALMRVRATNATTSHQAATQRLSESTAHLSNSQRDSSRATAELETHLRRVTTVSNDVDGSFGRLGARLRSAFQGSPLAGMVQNIRRDSGLVNRDLHQLANDVGRAGTRGGGAFTRGFVGVVGGLSAVTPAAGAAGAAVVGAAGNVLTLGASLGSLAGVAALVPAGLLSVGGAAGVMGAAFHGMGDALSTATEASKATAGNAKLDAMALEDAARQISDAEQRAGEVQVQSAKKVESAKRNLTSVVAANAAQQEAALRRVADAEQNVERANRSVLQSQQDLNQARADAVERLADLNKSLEQAGLSERGAALRYEDALAAFNEGVEKGGDPASKSMRKLKLDLDQAAFSLQSAKDETAELRDEQAKASKDGVDGSKQVKSAEQALADARRSATEAVRDRADAVRDVAKVEAEGAQNIVDAQEAIADATQNAAAAQVDAARSVSDAYRSMERLQMQQADAAAKAGAAAATAMAALTPAAQTAVRALLEVFDQLGNIRRIAQESFFTGFAEPLLNLSRTIMPQLAVGVGLIATALGGGAQMFMNSLSGALGGGVLTSLMTGIATSIDVLNKAIDPLVRSFVTLGVVGMDYMPRLSQAIVNLAEGFNGFIQDAAADGRLVGWIDAGIQGFKDLGSIVGSVSGIIGSLTAAAEAGGAVATLGGLAEGLRNIDAAMQGETFQATMATIFAGAEAGSQGLLSALTAIGDAFVVGADSFAEFLRLGGEISGAFIGGIFTALSNPDFGSGLITFLESVQRGVDSIVPLMPGLTGAFGSILESMAPIVENLGPSLVTVFTTVAGAVGGLLGFFGPFLETIAGSPVILGLLIGAFAATAGAVTALTLAGNIQKIAMAGWKVATFLWSGAVGAASIAQGIFTAAMGMGSRSIIGNKLAILGYRGAMMVGAAATAVATGAQWLFNKALTANPIGIIIVAVAALVGALVWFFTQTELGQQIVQNVFAAIKIAIAAVVDWWNSTLIPALQTVGQWFKDVWDGAAKAVEVSAQWIMDAAGNIASFFDTYVAQPVKLALEVMGAAFTWLYETIIKPVFDSIYVIANGFYLGFRGIFQLVVAIFKEILAPAFMDFWHGTVEPVFAGIGALIGLWWGTVSGIFTGVVTFIQTVLGVAFTWFRDSVITPVFNFIRDAIGFWWAAVSLVFNTVVNFLRNTLSVAFTWLRDSVITPVFNGIKWAIEFWWIGVSAIFNTVVNFLRDTLGTAFTWLRDSVITPVWNGIRDTISNAWNNGIKPVFDFLAKAITETLPEAFQTGVEAAKTAWLSLAEAAKTPVRFVIQKVINGGLIGAFNNVAKLLPGVDTLADVEVPGWLQPGAGFAKGGWTGPGSKYEPAGVVHADEFVIRKESQNDLRRRAPGFLDSLNQFGAKALGYANGGVVNPLKRMQLTQGYNRVHKGIDLAASVGTPVFATQDGTVTLAGQGASAPGVSGGLEVHSSGGGLETWFAHLSNIMVRVGDSIRAGQQIGLSGNTGITSGPHLHFGVFKGGWPNDLDASAYLGGGITPSGGDEGGGFNPIAALVGMAREKISAQFPGGGRFVDLAMGTGEKLIGGVSEWVQGKLGSLVDTAVTGVKNVAGDIGMRAKWMPMINAALIKSGHGDAGLLGNSASMFRRMMQESGGDPRAINNWDSNAAMGQSSRGLMQVIPSTFEAYRDRSLSSDIFDPMANMVAAIRYTKSRYGNLRTGWDQPGGYAKGGLVTDKHNPLLYDNGGVLRPGISQIVNATGKPEAIYTNEQNRALQALAARGAQGLDASALDRLTQAVMGARPITVQSMSSEQAQLLALARAMEGIG